MKCKRPFYLRERALLVPCGKCTYCRIVKRREWTLRILHELESYDRAVFVTLTYDDEHIPFQPKRPVHYPLVPSLSIQHLQKFFKRLRRRVTSRIRYYACGEYGEMEFRPHYHAIIFGVGPNDGPVRAHHRGVEALPGHPLRDSWNAGLVDVGFAEPDSIAYVASYVDKKRYGEAMAFTHYQFRQPEFQLQSLGIGKEFLDSRAGVTLRRGSLLRHAKEIGLPRYYLTRLNSKVYSDVRAIDFEVFRKKRKDAIIKNQVGLCELVAPDIGGIPYREMDDAEFSKYCQGLYTRNAQVNLELIGKGKIKGRRKL